MKMGFDLSPRQSQTQKQVLSRRMIQAMKVLQMPLADLQERIEAELQENPVLELRDSIPDRDSPEPEPSQAAEFDPNTPIKHDESNELDFERLAALDRELEGHFNAEEHRPSRAALDELGDKKLEAMNNMAERPQSLQDYLSEQLAFLDLSEAQRELVEYLIANLDERGYLSAPLYELARIRDNPVAVDELEDALDVVHKLDPAGIGARDAKECLLLQIEPDAPHADLMRQLVLNHLEDVAANRLPVIQKKTGADIPSIKEAVEELKHLDPRPGARFHSENTHYVTPDVIVEPNEAGGYDIKLTDDWSPRLRIPARYYQMYKDRGNDPETRKFLKEKLQSAEWLRDAINQRRGTLEKVTRAIIDHQKAFLDKGPEYVEPLKMQQIADLVGVHVTTVSRAVDDKWILTPRGVFPLKRFFVGAAKNDETGEEVAWERIKQKLQDLVGQEDKANPLSDEDLEKMLNEAGYPVKRRTVTKYRKLLRIPSSRQRKEWAG